MNKRSKIFYKLSVTALCALVAPITYSMDSFKKLAMPVITVGISMYNPELKTEGTSYRSALDVIQRCKPWPLISYERSCGKHLDQFNVNNFDSEGYTALHWAANHKEIPASAIDALLKRGAYNAPSKSRAKETPLHTAASWGNTEKVETLLKSGIQPDPKNRLSFTPLHEAALWGRVDTVKTLIAYGANVNAQTKLDQTVLDLALKPTPPILEVGETIEGLKQNKLEVAEILRKSGAFERHDLEGRRGTFI